MQADLVMARFVMVRQNSVLPVGKQAVGSAFNCFLPESKVSSAYALTLSPETGGDSPSASSGYSAH